ncbi:MbeB family mobilization protein (plasmid) [Escherichia coli]
MKERAESTEKMLNDEFRKLEESVNRELTSNEIFNQERYQRPYNSPERTAGEVSENDRRYDGRALENRTENERETLAVADYRLSTDVCHDRESAVVPGHEDKREYEYSPRAERDVWRS